MAKMKAIRPISPCVRPKTTGSYYHGPVLWVTRSANSPVGTPAGDAVAVRPTALAAAATAANAVERREEREDDPAEAVRISADTRVATTARGPFEPLGLAIEHDGAIRDVLASELAIPALRGYARTRALLAALAILPAGMVLELDRELAFGPAHAGASLARIVVDVVLVAFVGFELSRRTPRMPRVAALALVTVCLRWILVITRHCAAGVHPLVYAAAALSGVGAAIFLTRVPSRQRVALELLDRLGISRSAWLEAVRPGPLPAGRLSFALGVAAGLPVLLYVARTMNLGLWLQAVLFLAYGILAPAAVLREPGVALFAGAGKLREPVPPTRTLVAVAVGLALTGAGVTAANVFFDAGTEVARCVNRLDAETRRALAVKAAELTKAVTTVRTSSALLVMTGIVFPFVEERIFRGLLQETLVRKYGRSYGIFAASLVFAAAHFGIYQVALYQTLLLGLGFGIAYAEGGLVAALIVHATWNLVTLAS